MDNILPDIQQTKSNIERSIKEKNGMCEKEYPEESKRKQSEVRMGEKNPFYGKHHSEEAKKKMSISHKIRKERLKRERFNKIKPLLNINNYEIKNKLNEIIKESKVRKDGRRYYHYDILYSHIVWNFYNPLNQISKEDMYKYLIHHKDENYSNDDINNLEKIKWGHHTSLHMTGNLVGNKNPMYGKKHSEEVKQRISKNTIKSKKLKKYEK